jgi:hypothetical protein
MIPLNETLGLNLSKKEPHNSEHAYIYYRDGTLVHEEEVYRRGFLLAYKKGLIRDCVQRPFSRDNRLTEYGKAMMKLMS